MPGSPKKRSRREQQQTQQPPPSPPVLEALPSARSVEPTRARAHARVEAPAPREHAPSVHTLGKETRETVDRQQAHSASTIADFIRPGYVVRLYRTRPTWCAGFLEDYPISPDAAELGALLDHLRDNHGGQGYKLQVIDGRGVVLFEGTETVAGPPRDGMGRIINRAKWEGRIDDEAPQRERSAEREPPRRGADDLGGLSGLLNLLFSQQREVNGATINAVKELVHETRAQHTELLSTVVSERERGRQRAEPKTFSEQLGELAEATRSLDRVRKQLGPVAQHGPKDETPEDDLDPIVGEAKRQFVKHVFGSMFDKRNDHAAVARPPHVRPIRPARRAGQQN